MSARVDSGLAYEALMALSLGQGRIPAGRFADGAEQKSRFEALPSELLRAIRGIDAGEGQNWADLIGLVAAAPAPRGVPEFRRHLAALPPLELKLAMLGYHDLGFRAAVGDELFRAAAIGAERAQRRFKLRAAALGRPGQGQAGPLVSLPAELAAERTLAILDALPEALYLVRSGASQVLARANKLLAGYTAILVFGLVSILAAACWLVVQAVGGFAGTAFLFSFGIVLLRLANNVGSATSRPMSMRRQSALTGHDYASKEARYLADW